MSRRPDPEETFEPMRRLVGDGDPSATNKGSRKRWLKGERRLGGKHHWPRARRRRKRDR